MRATHYDTFVGNWVRVEVITLKNCLKAYYLTEENFTKQVEARYCSHCHNKPCIHLVKVNFSGQGDYALLGVCSAECEKQVVAKYK
jgi:hypothetical protein